METNKINLDQEINTNKLLARLIILLRKLPDLNDNSYESIARQLVRDNFEAEKIKAFEDHFILFSIGRPSVFDQVK
jgi:hypothetical protein